MKFEDETQNLKMRMAVIHGLVIAILLVLGVRLYFLQVVRGEYYAERARRQRQQAKAAATLIEHDQDPLATGGPAPEAQP